MSLEFYPDYGTVLICDFSTGFQPPEMVKKRPVVIVSPRKRYNAETVTIVPLSTRPPHAIHAWQHLIDSSVLPKHFQMKPTWAKCDMITNVALWRLDRMREKINGQRIYSAPHLIQSDIEAIRRGLMVHLALT